eukprot:642449-Heterocapsa_arctica.AAC.1
MISRRDRTSGSASGAIRVVGHPGPHGAHAAVPQPHLHLHGHGRALGDRWAGGCHVQPGFRERAGLCDA